MYHLEISHSAETVAEQHLQVFPGWSVDSYSSSYSGLGNPLPVTAGSLVKGSSRAIASGSWQETRYLRPEDSQLSSCSLL